MPNEITPVNIRHHVTRVDMDNLAGMVYATKHSPITTLPNPLFGWHKIDK